MKEFVSFLRKLSNSKDVISLHDPIFNGNEKKYLCEAIDSTYVSSNGPFVDRFEEMITEITGAKYSIATVNGTSALHIALIIAGAKKDREVITQPITFVATCNAIKYTGANPIFIDIDKDTMGMSPSKLRHFLEENSKIINNKCINKKTGKIIQACIPMHTFGFPCRIDLIKKICEEFKIKLIEDSAESLGSCYKNKSTGTFGLMGVFSFNGNKIATSGGGGVIITDNEQIALKAKHITTTSKVFHEWEYNHDEIGYNYRMPNINAALACAQLEQLEKNIQRKKTIYSHYESFFKDKPISLFKFIEHTLANYWLIPIIFPDSEARNKFLKYTNSKNIKTRPIWRLMNKLEMFKNYQMGDLKNSLWIEQRVVNIPSNLKIK